jgi:lysozyme
VTVDDPLLRRIMAYEGFTPRAAWDYRQHSNGYGTRARAPGEVIDQAEAERRLQSEVANAAAQVDRFNPNLPPGVRSALTSLTYNSGAGWQNAGLGAAIKAGNYDDARSRFLQYTKAGGQTLPGLVSRRQDEIASLWDGGAGNLPEGSQERAAGVAARLASNDTPSSESPPEDPRAAPAALSPFTQQEPDEPQTMRPASNDQSKDLGALGMAAILSQQRRRSSPFMRSA